MRYLKRISFFLDNNDIKLTTMEIDLTRLRGLSVKLDDKLRFPINKLQINVSGNWKIFKNFITTIHINRK